MTTITALPDPPDRSDPTTFSTKGDALMGALPTFVTETNTVAAEVAANAATATTQAGLATTNGAAQVALATAQVALATTQANNAANSATASANSALVAGAVVWVSGTTYAIGDCRYSPIDFQTYRRTTSGAGTTDPSLDSTNWTKALASGVTSVTTATTATTLTSTATLLKITPTSYGVAVTLPDATTCSLGGPLHIIDNKGAYPVRVLNSAGTLLGFVFGGVVSHVSLADNSTAAGVWTIENSELVGASAQLLTTSIGYVGACVALDTNREILVGCNAATTAGYAVVYDKSSNTFGTPVMYRNASVGQDRYVGAVKSATDQVLVVTSVTTAFEAVTLSISGTTITVNTAATATLSATISTFADGCGLIAVGSSFVCSYTVATPAAQIRALSISGTTVTIGSATVLDGTAGGLIAASGSVVIAVSAATSNFYTKPYTVSGSTLTPGTGTTTAAGSTVNVSECKLAALGTRWFTCYRNATPDVFGGVISLSGTTTTISTATMLASTTLQDAIVVGNTKVLALGVATSSNANILTDTAGTASAGTSISLGTSAARGILYKSSTDVYVQDGTSTMNVFKVDCSGASAVLTSSQRICTTQNVPTPVSSNSVLSRSPDILSGSTFVQTALPNLNVTTSSLALRVNGDIASTLNSPAVKISGTRYRGKADSERWVTDAATVIAKLECVA